MRRFLVTFARAAVLVLIVVAAVAWHRPQGGHTIVCTGRAQPNAPLYRLTVVAP